MSDRQGLRISDHALVRFLERAGGHDIAAIRDALSASLDRARVAAGAVAETEYAIVADGLSYVVRHGTVVTVLEQTMPPKKVRP
ncbi:MAG: hypothetical protein WD928_05120 [Gammaproteobacteria bacterium]